MDVNIVRSYMDRSDDRGRMVGIVNSGHWREANYVETKAGRVRGGHYHKDTHELVFIVSGAVEVELRSVHDADDVATLSLGPGEGLRVDPYVLHTMRYTRDTVHVSLLDRPFDPDQPDLHLPGAD